MDKRGEIMENERSEPGHLKNGGVDNRQWKMEKAGCRGELILNFCFSLYNG